MCLCLADEMTASSEITVDTSSGMDLPPAVAEPSGLSVEWAGFCGHLVHG